MDLQSLLLIVLGIGLIVVMFRMHGPSSATHRMAAGRHVGHGIARDTERDRSMAPGASAGDDPHAAHNRSDETADAAHSEHGCC